MIRLRRILSTGTHLAKGMAGDRSELKGQPLPPPDSGHSLRSTLTGLLSNKDHPQKDTIWQMSEEGGQEEQLLDFSCSHLPMLPVT